MKHPITYLSQLKFDPKLGNTRLAKYIINPRLVFLLVLTVVLVGLASFFSIPKVLNPAVKIPIVIVTTALPGASPKDVESLVTIPLEDSVSGLSQLKTVSSTSQDSVSVLSLEFESGVDPEKARTNTQSAVDAVALPKDAKTPKVEKLDFENQPVWSFSLTSKSDVASLMRFGKILRDRIKDLPHVDRVTTTGLEDQEIQIVIKPEAIAAYQLNPQLLGQAISTSTTSFPAGSVQTDSSTFGLTIDPAVMTVGDLRDLQVAVNGKSFLLSDIAIISEKTKPDSPYSYLATNKTSAYRTIRFDVYKTGTATIAQTVADAKKEANATIGPYDGQFTINSIFDTGAEIDRQFNELIRDLSITVGLVFIMLFIFLGIRQAIVASFSIPLTFLITFSVMHLTNIDLSFIAFFSLLLSLGLLVDDTVVVISAMTAYFRSGKFTPLQTGLLVWRDFIIAIFTTTITTVWAFIPLLLASGIIGEFIKPIPIVVSSTLLASFGVAMLITLPLIVFLLAPVLPGRVKILLRVLVFIIVIVSAIAILPKNKLYVLELIIFLLFLFITYQIRTSLVISLTQLVRKQKLVTKARLLGYLSNGIISFEIIGRRYRRLLDTILSSKGNRRKALAMVIIFSLFAYILLPLGFVKNEFFPKTDQDQLFLNLQLPPGTNLQQANQEAVHILNDLRHTQNVSFVTANIGFGFSSGGNGFSSADASNVLFTLILFPVDKRNKSSIDIAESLREKYKGYQKGNLSVVEESGGPPAGSDLQIKLFGDDLALLDQYANKLEEYLKKQPGVDNIDKSIKPGTGKLVFVPDKKKVADVGLTTDQLGFWLRTYASGFTVESVKLDSEGNDSKDITIRSSASSEYADTIDTITIPTPTGNTVPLASLGSIVLKANPTLITRENSKRTISVTASVRKGYSVTGENKKLEDYVNTLNLPQGYSWKTGGANEENQNSVNSILQAMLLSFLLIIITMVLQFSSFRRALIVMLVIPLSIAGVFIIFSLTHTPLSFPALIGVLALFGIVVKNSILVVDKILQNIKAGILFKYAIIDAAESRLEPIALTSFTAIVGLLPITLSNPLWRGLGGAIIAGLTFSGTIMLFFIPVVYYLMFNPERVEKRGIIKK